MLADGVISEEEQEIIAAEARRLHLSKDEVDRLIEKAHRQREASSNHAQLSVPQLLQQPAAAVERYRELLSQINQLAHLGNRESMDAIIESPGRVTDLEREIWKRLSAERQPAPPEPSH